MVLFFDFFTAAGLRKAGFQNWVIPLQCQPGPHSWLRQMASFASLGTSKQAHESLSFLTLSATLCTSLTWALGDWNLAPRDGSSAFLWDQTWLSAGTLPLRASACPGRTC